MGIAGLSTLFTTPAAGVLIDRFGRKRFLSLGCILMALSTIPFAFFDALNYWFHLLRIVHGAAFSLCFTAAGTLSADLSPPSRRSQALGLFGVFTIVNYALAPFIGKRVIEHLGFTEFFLIVFAVGLLSFVVTLAVNETRFVTAPVESLGFFKTLGRKGVPVASVVLLITGSGFIPALTFLPVYSIERGIGHFDVFFISYTAAALAIRLFGGWIPDRLGKKRAATPGILTFSLSIVSLSFVADYLYFIPSGIVFGASHGLLYPSIYALVMDLIPQGEKGKGFSICSMSFTVGGMIGSFVYGVVAEHRGYPFMYALAGLVCVLGFIIFALFGRDSVYTKTSLSGSSSHTSSA
jgi:MFS family permease